MNLLWLGCPKNETSVAKFLPNPSSASCEPNRKTYEKSHISLILHVISTTLSVFNNQKRENKMKEMLILAC
jgi:hypothetical protein